jgi:very-short-patch-repair endonuclease
MGGAIHRSTSDAWVLAGRQHGVVARHQLLELGLTSKAIEHRIARGRLHRVCRGVYAVGRSEVTVHGRWMAAVLSCGPAAVLSHESAAALWDVRRARRRHTEVSVRASSARRRTGIVVHRRPSLTAREVTRHHGIPVTTPVCTLVDIASRLDPGELEAAVNEADKLDLTDPEALRDAVDEMLPRPGIGALRRLLDRRTFTLTDSELERRFLPVARKAGLPAPQTGRQVNGYEVDFYWPELGLVVETDGLRYHRTPAQQARDRIRDQAHTAAGLTTLRFTRAQVKFEQGHVQDTLATVARRLGKRAPK